METPKEKKLDEVLFLLEQDIRSAIIASKALNKGEYEVFQHYLSNMILHAEAAQYRGKVMEMSIILEVKMAKVLSSYFGAKEKVDALNSMIFDRMDLQKKVNVFKTILKVKHPQVWERERTLVKKIDKLISFRNNLAHSMLNSTLEYNKKFRRNIEAIMKEGTGAGKIDEVEFFENHDFVFRTIKREEISDYHQQMFQIFKDVDRITKEILPSYE